MRIMVFVTFCLLLSLMLPASAAIYRLTVKTTPVDADVYIMNISPKYRPGIPLKPGKYDILVKRNGYHPYRKWVHITNRHVSLNVKLKSTKTYRLHVNTLPEDAAVKILNIVPKFKQGIALAPGKYELQITHPNYPERRQWVELSDRDVSIDVLLDRSHATLAVPHDKTAGSKLYVKTKPTDATVRIMNIVPKYTPGMVLKPGRYYLRVLKNGYPTRRQWVELGDEDLTVNVNLSPPQQCFFAQEKFKNQNITHSAKVKFLGHMVDVNYFAKTEANGKESQSDYLELRGTRDGDALNLIGLVDYQNGQEELQAEMRLTEKLLWVNMRGRESVLRRTECR